MNGFGVCLPRYPIQEQKGKEIYVSNDTLFPTLLLAGAHTALVKSGTLSRE